MNNFHINVPKPVNEPVLSYAPKSKETTLLKSALSQLKSKVLEIPMVINGKKIKTNKKVDIFCPHELKHKLGNYYLGDEKLVELAIDTALKAKLKWENMSWENRSAIFMKAADLLANKYRFKMNAATMLGQSKNCYQAEIDSACELVDFLRFNVYFLDQIYRQQPQSLPHTTNRLEYRPLEGFVLAITPFNFTAIGGNLPTAPALCSNVVVWKPAETQIYSASVFMDILIEAGLPPGVINLVFTHGRTIGEICTNHRLFSGLHFTGSTPTFNFLWLQISQRLNKYVSYPRIVGETGGKNFILAHQTADVNVIVTALLLSAFEYQGQKCSACSRAYLPKSLAKSIIDKLIKNLQKVKMGSVEDFSNLINAVIDAKAYKSITEYIEFAKKSPKAKILYGGNFSCTEGYFIEPTVVLTTDPKFKLMCEEIFGPVVTLYVYDDKKWEQIIDIIDNTSIYGLTGSILCQDRYALELAMNKLKYAAGNLYINDKPTGAVVDQQPFGGGRYSGTNDKAGSPLNLYRWINPRAIKENFNPPTTIPYRFLDQE